MTKDDLQQELGEVMLLLSAEDYPQTYDALSSLSEKCFENDDDAYRIANDLLQYDKPEDLPPFVIDFITDIFSYCIGEGNADAMNDLGAQYYDGSRGFKQSFELAIHYYDMAAKNGSRQAQENLGYCYYYGRSVPVDYEKAFYYFALGAFDGHLISLYKIGDMYAAGYYVEKNETEAFRIYMRCLDTMTDEAAPTVAGPVYLRLGKMFLNGIGTRPDAKSALVCYQKAESFLYDMVKNGDVMYRKSLQASVEGQKKAREKLLSELTGKQWLDGIKD